MKRPRIGDVIEIDVRSGLAYAQYTHRHSNYGDLLRVLPGIHGTRPPDLAERVGAPSQFRTFFPLGAACARKLVTIVGVFPIPPAEASFPVFRSGVHDPSTGKVGDNWWLWDGRRAWRVGALTAEQRRLPIRGVINDTLLIERIRSGWTAEEET
jgi:hypothetical protein